MVQALLGLSLVYAGYFVLRFGGLWTENDTAVFSSVTMQMLHTGNALFPGQYAHGYAYPAWMGSLCLLTGVRVPVMNTVVLPFVGLFFLTLTGFLTFRTWLRSDKWATLGVLLLFGSPDLLFSALRGNHEKLNIVLLLMVFYTMVQGFYAIGQGRLRQFAVWTLLMYVFEFTNSTVNDYFASTLAAAATIGVVTSLWLIRRARPARIEDAVAVRRLRAVVGTTWLLVLWVMFFVFPPSGRDFELLKTAGSKLISLFLTFHAGSNPYVLARAQWAGAVIIDLMAAYRWALFLSSFAVWLCALWIVIVRRRPLEWNNVLLTALYGSFGFTIVAAIPVDFAGLAAGANLEVRNFIYFVLFAVPMLLYGVKVAYHRWKPIKAYSKTHLVRIVGGTVLAGFIAIGLLKATLDPVISNQWMFYRPSERQAVTYFWTYAANSILWTGSDNRLVYMSAMWDTGDPKDNMVVGFALHSNYRNWLRSPVVVRSAVTQGSNIPDYQGQDRVYDAGQSQLYHMRPRSLFQD